MENNFKTKTYSSGENSLRKNQVFIEKQINGGNVKVNIRNKDFTYTKPLLSFVGENAMGFDLVYNSINSSSNNHGTLDTHFFKGWQTNFHQYCYPNGNGYIYIDGIGFRHDFLPSGTATYVDNSGLGLKLKTLDNTLTILNIKGDQLVFNSDGRIQKIKVLGNVNWHETFINYNSVGQITSVTDPLGNFVNFSYPTSESVTFIDNANRKYSVTGDNGFLSFLREGDYFNISSDSFSYYSSSGLLTEISDNNNNVLHLTYPSENKMRVQLSVRKTGPLKIIEKEEFEKIGNVVENVNLKGVVTRYFYDDNSECTSSYEVKYGECFGAAFRSREDYQNYSKTLSKRFCYLGAYQQKTKFSVPASSSVNVISFFRDADFVAGKNHIVSLELDIPSLPQGYASQRIQLFNGNNSLIAEKTFQIYSIGKQVVIIPFGNANLNGNFSINILNASNFSISYSNVKISEELPTNSLEVAYCNKDTGESSFLDKNNVRWYKLKKPNGILINNSYVNAAIYENDFFANFFSYASKGESNAFDVWKDELKGIVPNATGLEYDYGLSKRYNLLDMKLATCMEKGDDKYLTTYELSGSSIVIKHMELNAPALRVETSTFANKTGLLLSKTETTGITCSTVYDNDGYVTQEKIAKNTNFLDNIIYSYSYENKKLKSESNYMEPIVNTTTFNNSAASLDSVIDPLNRKTAFSYNHYQDRLTKVSSTVDNVENANNVSYSYKMPESLSHSGVNYSFVYDEFNRISDVKIAGNQFRPSTVTRLTSTDEIVSTYKNNTPNCVEKRELDQYGRLKRVFFKNSDSSAFTEALSFIYASDQAKGRAATSPDASDLYPTASSFLCKVIDKLANTDYLYFYDDAGFVNQVTVNANGESGLSYKKIITRDSFGRLTNETYDGIIKSTYSYYPNSVTPSESVTYSLVSPTDSYEILSDTTYLDSLNRLKGNEIDVGGITLKTNYTYADRISAGTKVGTTAYIKSYVVSSSVKTSSPLISGSFTYNKNGNITAINSTEFGVAKNRSFAYDGLNRIKEDNSQILNSKVTYNYDSNGNITSKTKTGYNGSGTPTTVNYGYSPTNKDLLTSYNGKSITYDECLNPTRYLGITLKWERGRLLTNIANPNTNISSVISYDASGNRTKMVSKTMSWITATRTQKRDGTKLISDTVSIAPIGDKFTFVYIYTQSGISGFCLNNKIYTYLKNALGDVVAILDDNHNVVASYEYDAFGKCVVYDSSGKVDTNLRTLGNVNAIRYRSYSYDFETNLYYLQSRYYDPETGRFINPDDVSFLDPSTINGLNLFAYCLNNPIMLTDSTGCSPSWDGVLKVLGWVAVGVLTVAATATVIAGTVFTGGLLGAVLVGAGIGAMAGIAGSIVAQGGIQNIENINPWKVALTGLIGGAIGAATGAFSYGISVIGAAAGQSFGYALSQSVIGGLKVAKVFSAALLMGAGKFIGGLAGGFIGTAIGDYFVNNAQGKTTTFGGIIESESSSWITDFIRWLLS